MKKLDKKIIIGTRLTFLTILVISFTVITGCNNKSKSISTDKSQRWYVQYAIDENEIDSIVHSLRREFECRLVSDIKKVEVTSAGVHCYEGKLFLIDKEIKITKQTYIDWKAPIFYFNWDESLYDKEKNSTIKRIYERLKMDGLKVTLIDYGELKEH